MHVSAVLIERFLWYPQCVTVVLSDSFVEKVLSNYTVNQKIQSILRLLFQVTRISHTENECGFKHNTQLKPNIYDLIY